MRCRWLGLVALWVVAVALACTSDSFNPVDPGAVDQPCYANGTCNAGLTCESKVCVDLGGMDATTDAPEDHRLGDMPDTATIPDTSTPDTWVPDAAMAPDTTPINGNMCPTSPSHTCDDAGQSFFFYDDAGWWQNDTFETCDPDASDVKYACTYSDAGAIQPSSTTFCETLKYPCPSGWSCLWTTFPPDGGKNIFKTATCP